MQAIALLMIYALILLVVSAINKYYYNNIGKKK